MTQEEFFQFERELSALCSQFGIWIKSRQQYADRPKDKVHYVDIQLRAKIDGELHILTTSIQDIAETFRKI